MALLAVHNEQNFRPDPDRTDNPKRTIGQFGVPFGTPRLTGPIPGSRIRAAGLLPARFSLSLSRRRTLLAQTVFLHSIDQGPAADVQVSGSLGLVPVELLKRAQ